MVSCNWSISCDNLIILFLNLQVSLKGKKEHLEKLQQQNSRLEHEVKRYQERERHLEKIKMLEKKKPWAVSVIFITSPPITHGY